MPEKRKYTSSRLYLRLLTRDDVSEEYCGWLNNPHVNKYLETWEMTTDKLHEYVQQQIDNLNCRFYGVFDKVSHKHIGNVRLAPIRWSSKTALFGILIGNQDYWGKGIGTEAIQLAIHICFNHLGLDEVTLGAIADNKKACRAYEKAGFKVAEYKNKAINHDGMLYDAVYMVINKSDQAK